jgi:broad specificity phosphatase PhoE
MQTLYFIRHGESEDNAAGVWAHKTSPLTEKGKEQARQTGREARQQGLQFDVILVSPLPRTQQTAQLIAEELGHPMQALETINELVERDWGSMTGTPHISRLGSSVAPDYLEAASGTEKLAALQDRAARVLAQLRERPEEHILVVGHGAFARALRRVLTNRPATEEYDAEARARIYLQNAQIVRLI